MKKRQQVPRKDVSCQYCPIHHEEARKPINGKYRQRTCLPKISVPRTNCICKVQAVLCSSIHQQVYRLQI